MISKPFRLTGQSLYLLYYDLDFEAGGVALDIIQLRLHFLRSQPLWIFSENSWKPTV